jgi:hypothetical protein
MSNFIEGEVYFRLVYPDAGFLYPIIESFVYVGMNLSDEDKEDTWYFQFATDYAKHGSFLSSEHSGCKVSCVNSSGLPEIYNSTELKKQLDLAELRRTGIRAGSP